MNEIEMYLNRRHREIRKVVYFAGGGCSDWQLRDFLEHTDLDAFTLTGFLETKKGEKILEALKELAKQERLRLPEKIEFCSVDKLETPLEDAALVCTNVEDSRDMLRLSTYKPKWLLATTIESGISAHTIWEAYRKCCEHILIVTNRHYAGPQVLDWDKNPENNIELSVIFPMYNVEKYLDQCIQSVTAWKADYVEFLFVNDGSPDNSREVVLRYAAQDARVKLLDKPNGGCASARQWGLDRAKGRYVGFIDPDDFIDESMFRKLLRAAMVGSYDISYCGHNEFYESTGTSAPVGDLLGAPYCYGVTDVHKIQELIAWRRVAIWRGIYKMDMIRKSGIHFYTEIRRFDDLPFFIETTAAARSIISVNEHLYYYRLDRPGQDVSADDQRLYVHFPIFAHLNDSIAGKKDAKLTDMLQVSKVGTHRYALEKLRPEFIKEYADQVREDLKTTGTFWRSYFLIRQMSGREHAKFYWAIMTQNYGMLNRLRKNKGFVEKTSAE